MKKNKNTHIMASILIIVFSGLFLLLAGRFFYIQATGEVAGVSLKKMAEENRTTSYTLDAERGKIYDRNGMTLAYDRPTYRLQAILDKSHKDNDGDPDYVKNPEEMADKVADILDEDKSYFLDRLQTGIDNDKFQVEFGTAGKNLSQETKKKLEEKNIQGIKFAEGSKRYYPNGKFASKIIGFARKDGEKFSGVTGIEHELNDTLSGQDGYISYEHDYYGTKLLNPDEVIQKADDGNDVYLTIDQKIQMLLEDAMSQMDEKYDPERMTATVMDPSTGEVLALSNRPTFDPNHPDDVENWYNDVIATPTVTGSTMKIFTWASAIEEGVYQGDEWFKSGTYKVNDRVQEVKDHNNGEGWGSITYNEGFIRSSNVAAAKLLWEKIGTEDFLEYWEAFDFDEKTGINLPGEKTGKLVYNYPRDKISTAFGQASTITPIQEMKAASAIANEGTMMKPHIISETVDSSSDKSIKEKTAETAGQPISKETSEQMLELMHSVVSSEHGTGKEYALKDYDIAGKTGTSQLYENGHLLTGHGNNTFSFLGMAPKDDPQLMMYVSVKKPELANDEAGKEPVSFIFKNVMQNSLHYLDIKPEEGYSEDVKPVEIPKIINRKTDAVKKELRDTGLELSVIGSGNKIKKSSANKGDELLLGDRIILVTDEPEMPDLTGWSLKDVFKLGQLLDLDVESEGSGYVVNQAIDPGKSLKEADNLDVQLKPPQPNAETSDQTNG